jgi:hypothetical protein
MANISDSIAPKLEQPLVQRKDCFYDQKHFKEKETVRFKV